MVCPLAGCPKLFLVYFPFPCALGCDQSHTQQKLQILEVRSQFSGVPSPSACLPLASAIYSESPQSGSDFPCLTGTRWNWVRTQAERDTNSTWELETGQAPAQPSGPQPLQPWKVLCVCVYSRPPSPVTLCTVWSVTLLVIMSLFCSGGPGTSAEPQHIFVALAQVPHCKCFISPAAGLLARRECPNPGFFLLRSFVWLMNVCSSSWFFPHLPRLLNSRWPSFPAQITPKSTRRGKVTLYPVPTPALPTSAALVLPT